MKARPVPISAVALGLAVIGLVAACTPDADPGPPAPTPTGSTPTPAVTTASPTPSEPVSLRVAFVETLTNDEPDDRVTAAFQAARLAFSNAELVAGLPVEVDVAAYDTEGDPARTAEISAEIASTPEVVAVIGAPGLIQQQELGDALSSAGIPWLSLSGEGARLGGRGWTGWRRLVADQATQGETLGGVVATLRRSEQGVCAMGDGTPPSDALLRAATRTLGGPVVLRTNVAEAQPDVAAAGQAVARARCGVVLWGGGESAGAALRRQLVEEGLREVAFVGGDAIRDRSFLEAVGPAGEGTLATCPCVDVSTSIDLAAQRFIQDYQSEFGLPPGAYAVEAWDAARILVAAFREGATTREAVRGALGALTTFDGLARTYRFGADGDLVEGPRSVRLSLVEGGRWLELPTTTPLH
ncbi:MAG TPA: branched-chain amino acid ABC transporter substrate-binding protein [Actinomycetota bacterium]|nr:branched-chain amino acid ABC transporter substrate-binding protein [Actinomycetota bacterium]